MERNYQKINKIDDLKGIVIPIILGIIFAILLYKIHTSILNKKNDELKEKISVYEQILEYEYNRTFKSFEEYIVYKADKILKK